jgi:hypothetical protein
VLSRSDQIAVGGRIADPLRRDVGLLGRAENAERDQLAVAGVCVRLPALRKVVFENERPIRTRSAALFGTT